MPTLAEWGREPYQTTPIDPADLLADGAADRHSQLYAVAAENGRTATQSAILFEGKK